MNWAEFIDMGGYGFYVWSSFGLSLGSMLAAWAMALRSESAIRKEIIEEQSMQQWAAKEEADAIKPPSDKS